MKARDEAALLERIRGVQAVLEGEPTGGISRMLEELDREASEMNLRLCDFVRDRAPDFLPYYYLLEGSEACDDPRLPLWVREQFRDARPGPN